jgi:hypothetical protein
VGERKSVRGANRDDGAGHAESGQSFRRAQALQARVADSGSDQVNAAEMDEALDAGRRLPRMAGMDRRRSVVVLGMRALRQGGAAPGHPSPGDRAQRKRRGHHRAYETSDPVFHAMNVATRLRGGKGSGAAGQRGSGAAGQRREATQCC